MASNMDEMLELMYEALGEPIGLLCATNDLRRAQSVFYAARKRAKDTDLDQLECRASPIEGGDFILVKRSAQGAEKLVVPGSPEEIGL